MTTTQASTQGTSKKSGRGITDGVISELAAFFTVKPGHEADLRAACKRLHDAMHGLSADANQQIGLRDSRMVMFDNDKRLLWTTTFETDWDPYLDDAMLLFGVDNFIDWMQHINEADVLTDWMASVGGRDALQAKPDDPEWVKSIPQKTAGLKRIIQSAQIPAVAYFNALADQTLPQVHKAQRVEEAFEQVLDDPGAADALQHPSLKPLLEQAAD